MRANPHVLLLGTAALAVSSAMGAAGCGATYYAVQMTGAASRVEEARTVHAAELAPYEYYYAREHLVQAQIEAARANYSDAAHYAEVADEYAGKAIELSDKSRSGSDSSDSKAKDENADSDKGDNQEPSTDHETESSP